MAKSKSKSRSKSKPKAAERRPVKLIPPSSDEARDEGPRLIPLGRLPEEPRVQRYLDLADAALNSEVKGPSKGKKHLSALRRP